MGMQAAPERLLKWELILSSSSSFSLSRGLLALQGRERGREISLRLAHVCLKKERKRETQGPRRDERGRTEDEAAAKELAHETERRCS